MNFDWDSSEYSLGETELCLEEICRETGRNYARTLERSGFKRVHRTGFSSVDFFANFVNQNLKYKPGDAIIIVNQSSGEKVPGLAPQALATLQGLEAAHVFEISDGCTGFVRALILANSIVTSGFAEGVTILCGEKYSSSISQGSNVEPIFSDAVSQIRVTSGSDWEIKAVEAINLFGKAEYISIRQTPSTDEFVMNGPHVMQWAIRSAKDWWRRTYEKTGISQESINRWYIHQGSKAVVEAIETALDLPAPTKFLASEYGNAGSSSIPILMIDSPPVEEETLFAALSFGIGLSMVGVVMERSR